MTKTKKNYKKWYQLDLSSDSEKEKLEQEKQENEWRDKVIATELKRKKQEEFISNRIKGGWLVAPILLSFVVALYLGFVFFFAREEFFMGLLALILPFIPPYLILTIHDEWEKKLECKESLAESNSKYGEKFATFHYTEDLIYFDSYLKKLFYIIGKIFSYLISWSVIGGLIWLLIYWINLLNPITIVIFLLVIIIFILLNRQQ